MQALESKSTELGFPIVIPILRSLLFVSLTAVAVAAGDGRAQTPADPKQTDGTAAAPERPVAPVPAEAEPPAVEPVVAGDVVAPAVVVALVESLFESEPHDARSASPSIAASASRRFGRQGSGCMVPPSLFWLNG